MMNTSYRWILLFAISIILFLINVDYAAVNLALVPMSADFGVNLNSIQFVLSGYALSWAIFVLPVGLISDQFRKQQVCLWGLGLFLLTSLLAGLATSANFLIIARLVQGFAGAICVPVSYALLFLNFAENERGRAIGLMSLGVGLGLAMGPFIGGLILSWLNWHWIFFINIPIGLFAAYIIYLGKSDERPVKNSIDLIARSSQLMANAAYVGCCIGIFLEQCAFSTVMVASGLYLQKVMQYSSLQSSLIYLSLTIIFGIIAAMGGPWIDRVGLRLPTLIGLMIMLVGSVLFVYLTPDSSVLSISLVLLLLGSGMGLTFSALNTGVIKTLPAEAIGIGSSIFVMLALIGNVLGIAMTAFIYQHSSLAKLLHDMQAYAALIKPSQLQQVISYVNNIGATSYDFSSFNPQIQTTMLNETIHALNHGLSYVMFANVIICLLALFLCDKKLRRVTSPLVG